MLKRMWKKMIQVQERRAAYWQLQNMTDKQLRDIGVSRSEIKMRCYL